MSELTPATPASHETEPAPGAAKRPSSRERLVAAAPWLRSGVGLTSAAVSLAVGVLTLLFLVRPALRPDDGPVTLGATLANPAVERGVTLGEVYERLSRTPPAEYSDTDLATPGVLVSFDVRIDGFQGEEATLEWTVLASPSMERVADPWLVDQQGWPAGVFIPEAERDSMNGQIWAQLPDRPGTYIIRLTLYDPEGVRLASLDTDALEQPPPGT
jgi:hypothetical protein